MRRTQFRRCRCCPIAAEQYARILTLRTFCCVFSALSSFTFSPFIIITHFFHSSIVPFFPIPTLSFSSIILRLVLRWFWVSEYVSVVEVRLICLFVSLVFSFRVVNCSSALWLPYLIPFIFSYIMNWVVPICFLLVREDSVNFPLILSGKIGDCR